MRLLILGGTAFLGRAIARHANAAGHHVTCLARGESGQAPTEVRFIQADRRTPQALSPLAGETFDAVVDVTSHPSQARRAVRELANRVEHWLYVSSISAYADRATVGQQPETAALLTPLPPQAAELSEDDPATYGAAKVACEQAVVEAMGEPRSLCCRAGLIVGPEDPSARFSYWVKRLARAGRVLAPGSPLDPVQLVDVRDLAAWLVTAAERRLNGVFNGLGPPMPRGDFLAQVAAGVGTSPDFTWVPQEFLRTHDVRPWDGERSLPLWVPLPDYAGFLTHDPQRTLAAGLSIRPLARTSADTHAWLADSAPETGLTEAQEAEVLRAWDQHR